MCVSSSDIASCTKLILPMPQSALREKHTSVRSITELAIYLSIDTLAICLSIDKVAIYLSIYTLAIYLSIDTLAIYPSIYTLHMQFIRIIYVGAYIVSLSLYVCLCLGLGLGLGFGLCVSLCLCISSMCTHKHTRTHITSFILIALLFCFWHQEIWRILPLPLKAH